ncbi:MAG: hypothetical protein ACYC96_14500 [Fimbriimonadaceae bacterium]
MNDSQPNGPAAAAALSVGVGALAFGVAVVLSEAKPAVAAAFNLYNPTGPLVGKTVVGIIVWLGSWLVLGALWKQRDVRLKQVLTASLLLIAGGFIATLPPVFDALAGK